MGKIFKRAGIKLSTLIIAIVVFGVMFSTVGATLLFGVFYERTMFNSAYVSSKQSVSQANGTVSNYISSIKNKLDNLCVIVDYNGLQIDGPVSEVGGPEPFDKKFEAFGFEVITVNGNDFDELEKAFAAARACKGKPFAIIAKTTKGKGVSYMENAVDWHGKAPNDEEYAQAMTELRAAHASLEKEIEFNNG